ncbi:hypothetical protein ABZ490_51465 [Streptomyces sp. NPDC005811]|uniref:hypothetical protein n=1 Tax=Streptomyces sp. NPDC005811 TaxID=3154565 RepID=UPI003406129C
MTKQFVRKRWHYVLTLAWAKGKYFELATFEGSVAPLPGHSRQQLFNHLYNSSVKRSNETPDAYVLFFSLEPDELVPEE